MGGGSLLSLENVISATGSSGACYVDPEASARSVCLTLVDLLPCAREVKVLLTRYHPSPPTTPEPHGPVLLAVPVLGLREKEVGMRKTQPALA